jgi:hypothetical protein
MDDLDALLENQPIAPPTLAGTPTARKHRHHWVSVTYVDGNTLLGTGKECICGKPFDSETSRRGKNNRSRGNAIEREVAAQLGLRRVGQFGGPDDIKGAMFAGQVKSGAAFSEKLWRWLKAVPVDASQTAILVITDAPGPGHRRRAVVVVDLADWIGLHGPELDAA